MQNMQPIPVRAQNIAVQQNVPNVQQNAIPAEFYFQLVCVRSQGLDLNQVAPEERSLPHLGPQGGGKMKNFTVGRLFQCQFFHRLINAELYKSVSRHHFEIWAQERIYAKTKQPYTAIFLTNYSNNGTTISSGEGHPSQFLNNGDHVEIFHGDIIGLVNPLNYREIFLEFQWTRMFVCSSVSKLLQYFERVHNNSCCD